MTAKLNQQPYSGEYDIYEKRKLTVLIFATTLLFGTFAVRMKLKINWDALGISASLACAIHCALLPLFMTSLPLFGVNIIHNPLFEALMILLALAIGRNS